MALPTTITKSSSPLLDLIKQQCHNPFQFQPYHAQIRSPYDYYAFGIDLVKPLVDLPHSTVSGLEHIKKINAALKKGTTSSFWPTTRQRPIPRRSASSWKIPSPPSARK